MKGNDIPLTKGWTLRNEFVICPLITLGSLALRRGECQYPELMHKNVLKSYRYSIHMLPYSMLIEVGFNNNSRQESLNIVEPLADIIGKVFELKEK